MNDSSAQRSPTLWIVATALFAVATVGFAIWGFSTKSDLDDAEATVERQKQQLASQQDTAAAEEQQLAAFGRRERAAYRRVRRRLLREEAQAADLQKKVKDEAAALDQARTEVANAQGAERKEAARLKQAQAATRLAAACSASAVDALNRFFEADTAKAGAQAAVKQLESTQQECQTAAGG